MNSSLKERLSSLVGRGFTPSSDIEEELLYHLRSLVEDHQAKGLSATDAWDAAQAQFGSLQHYSRECRRAAGGAAAFWRLSTVAGLLLATGIAAWHIAEVRRLREAYANLERQT